MQQAFIKHGFVEELTEIVDFITDKQVAKELLSSNLFENKAITYRQGKILEIKFVRDNVELEFQRVKINFLDKKSQATLLLERTHIFWRGRHQEIQKPIK